MNNTPSINDIIASLLNDRHDDQSPTIPDGTIDLAHVITPLRTLTQDGRALYSDQQYAIAQMIGRLLAAYIPDNPTNEDMARCILGLAVLIARMLRTVHALFPEMSMEEFLIDPADQDDLIALARIMAATPLVTTPDGQTRPNIAQLPIFHQPTPITPEQMEGFGQRRIAPYENYEIPAGTILVTPVDPDDIPETPEETISDPLNGFDEFFDHYYETQPDDET